MSDQYWLNDQMDADDGMSNFLNLGGGNGFSQQSQQQPQQQDDFVQFNEFGDNQDFGKMRQTSGSGMGSFSSNQGMPSNNSNNGSASIDPMSILEKMHRQQKSVGGESSGFDMQDPQAIIRQHTAASTPAASSFSPSMMNPARVQMPQQSQLQQQQLLQQQQQLQQQRAMAQRQQQAQKQQQQQRVQQQQQNSRQQAFQQMQRQQQVQQMQQQHSFVQSPEQLGSQISTPMSEQSHLDATHAMRQQANAYQQRMASMPVQHQQQAFQQPQFSQPATGMAPAHMPQQSPQSPQAQNRQRQMSQAQMNQAQMNQAQAELFMMTLGDFLRQRGVQMPPTPIIDGKKVPLFFLYLLVSRLGGSDQVTKTGKWPFVAAKFTINVENNISAVREVEHVYRQVLLPFEQYAATPQGQKDLHQKKMYLQQQLQARYQQRQHQMQNQSQPPTPTVQSVPQAQHAMPQQMPFQQQQQQQQQPPQRSFTAPSPMLNQQKLQQQQRNSSVSSPQSMIAPNQRNSPAEFAPGMLVNRSSEPSPMSAQPVQAQSKSKAPSRKSSGSKSIAEPVATSQSTPPPPVEIVRNYVPFQRLVELNGAYDVKMLAQLSDQIDQARPVFLFAPELSSVDVHALTMSLFSGIDSEINTALNTLLVVSTDNNLMIPITECPDLLEALTSVGVTTLKKLVGSHSNNDDDFKFKPGPNTLSSQKIQKVFDDFVSSATPGEDIPVTVNSFTAGDVSKDAVVYPDQDNIVVDDDDSELEDDEEVKSEATPASPPSSPETPSDFDLSYFNLPSYMDVLIKCREETEDVFSEIHKRSYNDYTIMLLEQLSTITMVLKNLSFLERNSHFFAHSPHLLDFMFDLLFEISAHPEKLIFSRKRLCFIKDMALLFTNIAHLVHLRSAKEALLVIMLTTSLGGELKPLQKEEGFLIPEYLPQFHKYQPYGIDILSKLMVRDVPNKQLLSSVITGEIRLDNTVPMSTTQKETVKMIQLYAGEPKNGQLLTRIFSFCLSIVPLNLLAGGVGAISERSVTIYEALVGARMLVEMITIEHFKENLALQWLSTPERIGSGLLNLGFSLAAIAVKTRDNAKFGQIACESIGLLNSLLAKAIEYTEITEQGAAELASLPKLFPTVENFVGSIVTAGTDPRVKAEAVTLAKNISKLNSLVPNELLE